jgi:hypothetical protein
MGGSSHKLHLCDDALFNEMDGSQVETFVDKATLMHDLSKAAAVRSLACFHHIYFLLFQHHEQHF